MKRFLSILMGVAALSGAIAGLAVPVYADPTTTFNESSTGEMTIGILAVVDSSYTIALPASATVSLEKSTNPSTPNTYEGEYTITCYGKIRDTETVNVAPSGDTFTMTLATDDSVTSDGTVTQEKTGFRNTATADAAAIGTSAALPGSLTGSLAVELTEIGSYSGQLSFTYSKTSDSTTP
ncbi:MAG: hypothetical protein IJS80_00700 [Lachnospiraceae bacterium]|nr:hypothetical protein [Lachnospiraceae bacterium]